VLPAHPHRLSSLLPLGMFTTQFVILAICNCSRIKSNREPNLPKTWGAPLLAHLIRAIIDRTITVIKQHYLACHKLVRERRENGE
jgi:bifunctional N-acetylglucosamine-1-phosphate-uridyltransferase/glucosamine-1-phosphate-acetyltransferase GlmU-like protein